ncbi:DUF4157 domain-containing protein [Fluviicola chungangensis]|uniref:DUF4157 domain-containing protein n=1 Tax=Fluviicola chungangensis TaxID=2597671 RepID=A0A556MYD4_9FLAO|nr:DUF4157 domain-containing protein [Fluviicola chungangensis]TSJ44927.1 DUF4157 domain-containing protein [Fluviicola chungangensis]
MKTVIPNTAVSSETKTKTENQAPAESILQAYKQGITQLQDPNDEHPIPQTENKTGLPDNLKSGVESLSGHSLDDVKVHYNSSQPASLQAHAYAQGTDIHVAPGQEKYLPHEAWHVVQQKQGRVKPTKQLKGTTNINDDAGLEKEADVMGAKAMQLKVAHNNSSSLKTQTANHSLYQLQTSVNWTSQEFRYMDSDGDVSTKEVGGTMEAIIDPKDPIEGADAQSTFQKDMYDDLKAYWNPGAKHWVRGHLLNANLGGPNVAPNLFPITGHANGDHLNYVENHVKHWVISGNKVKYTVAATQEGGTVQVGDENVPNAAGSFDCKAEIIGGDKKIDRLIKSEPVKREEKDGAIAAGHTSSWTRQEDGDNQNFDKLILKWNSDQLNFAIALIENNFNTKQTIMQVPITLDDLSEIYDVLTALKESGNSDSDENDGESPDTEKDKVGSRVMNTGLKKWIRKSLNNTEANEWLTEHRDAENAKKYAVTGSALEDDEEDDL